MVKILLILSVIFFTGILSAETTVQNAFSLIGNASNPIRFSNIFQSALSRKASFESCSTDGECSGSRKCYAPVSDDEVVVCSAGSTNCGCLDLNRQSCSEDRPKCLSGDRCIATQNGGGACIACSLEDDIGGEELDDSQCVCIATHHLHQFHSSALVYSTHQRAAVLCDIHHNCATPVHMVIYKNKPMTMSSYCEMVPGSCVRRIMYVNSPRMSIGLRVASKSSHLQFTALAAAGNTRVERAFLSSIISLGV